MWCGVADSCVLRLVSIKRSVMSIAGRKTDQDVNWAAECVVTTFVGSNDSSGGGGGTQDGIGTAARVLDPVAMCLSPAFARHGVSQSLLFIQRKDGGGCVRRVYLPPTPEMKITLARSISDGLAGSAPYLSAISPLITLIA